MTEEYGMSQQAKEGMARADELQQALINPNDGVDLPEDPEKAPKDDVEVKEEIAPAPEPKPEDFQHKYQVLQGKYNKEVPELKATVRQLESQIVGLRELIANLNTPSSEATAAAKPAQDEDLNPDAFADYGDDIQKLAATAKRLDSTVKKLEAEQAQTKKTAEQIEEERFFNRVSELKPNWREVDDNPDWHAWLHEPCPLTGAEKRGILLKNAFDARDAKRAVALFKQFEMEKGIVAKEAGPGPEAEETITEPKPDAKKARLESRMAPDTAPGDLGRDSKKRNYTRAWIKKFYEDCTRGAYPDDAKRIAIERDILAASAEGRIKD